MIQVTAPGRNTAVDIVPPPSESGKGKGKGAEMPSTSSFTLPLNTGDEVVVSNPKDTSSNGEAAKLKRWSFEKEAWEVEILTGTQARRIKTVPEDSLVHLDSIVAEGAGAGYVSRDAQERLSKNARQSPAASSSVSKDRPGLAKKEKEGYIMENTRSEPALQHSVHKADNTRTRPEQPVYSDGDDVDVAEPQPATSQSSASGSAGPPPATGARTTSKSLMQNAKDSAAGLMAAQRLGSSHPGVSFGPSHLQDIQEEDGLSTSSVGDGGPGSSARPGGGGLVVALEGRDA